MNTDGHVADMTPNANEAPARSSLKADAAPFTSAWQGVRSVPAEPGKSHPKLPHPVDDAVLLSAGKRYEHLVSLVSQQYGEIDVPAALELMNRPVAMDSCLHRVLFAPSELELWVANAESVCAGEKYAACYQPYYHYSFKELLAKIPEDRSRVSSDL